MSKIKAIGLYLSLLLTPAVSACSIGGSTHFNSHFSSETTSAREKKTATEIGNWLTTTRFDFLGNKPMTKEMAASIIGNWMQESHLIVDNVNYNSGAYGYGQWLGERLDNLDALAKKMKQPKDSQKVQLAYFKSELENNFGPILLKHGFTTTEKNIEKLTTIFELKFEKAGKDEADIPQRIIYANDFMKYYHGITKTPTKSNSPTHSNASSSKILVKK